MVHSPKTSPNRRRSIAVLNMDASKSHPGGRRRAHSIAPGDKLSPYARSRRSVGPRKSILKQTHKPEEEVTQAMELTAALSRRVSFAKDTLVRLFQIQEQNTNSTGTPPSSPDQAPSLAPSNDENAYPGADQFNRSHRRSSLRRSFGTDIGAGEQSMELDMDDTAPSPFALMEDGDKITTEEFDEEEFGDGDDMDLTEIVRRRSIAQSRRRSSMGNRTQLSREEDGSDISGSVEGYQTEHMEFTMPLGKSLREPSPPPDEWHALRAMTHAGDLPVANLGGKEGNDDMDLSDAMSRLRAARDSFGLVSFSDHNVNELDGFPGSDGGEDQVINEPSFASTDSDSFKDDIEAAPDRTLNLNSVLQRESLGASSKDSTSDFGSRGRPSTTDTEDAQVNKVISPPPDVVPEDPHYPDLTEFNQSTSSVTPAPVFQKSSSIHPNLTVFTKPPKTSAPSAYPVRNYETPSAPVSKPIVRPSVFSSQTKSTSRAPIGPSDATTPANPLKRPLSVTGQNAERPSPVKKQAISRLSFGHPYGPPASQAGPSSVGKNAPPSPRKPSSPIKGHVSSAPGMRRTSATFARRRSAVVAFGRRVTDRTSRTTGRKSEPGEMSSPNKSKLPLLSQTTAERPSSPAPASPVCEREAVRQAISNPSPSRGSPTPETLQLSSQRPAPAPPQPSSSTIPLENPPEKPIGEHLAEDGHMMELWRDEVQDEGLVEDDGPPISIEQFLVMTGIKFMDELTAPRRSTILPSLLSASTSSDLGGDIPLADYVASMSIDLPQWTLYSGVTHDLLGMVDEIKVFYKAAERDVEKDVPALFREFATADDDLKDELLHQLKLIKANNHALARSQWYDWKLYWVSQFYSTADKDFAKLKSDATTLERVISEAQELLPVLREEYEEITKANEKEAAEVAEIEQCDQDYLIELRTSIVEQSSELDVFRAEVAETSAKLDRLNERSAEIEAEVKETRAAIAECERIIHIQKNSTKEEVFRLKEKLDALQELHLWRATKISSDMAQFIYATRYTVSIPCLKFKPVPSGVTISRLAPPANKRRDPFPHLSDLALQTAQTRISTMKGTVTNHQILQFLSDFWTSIVQLRSQVNILAVKYPVSIEPLPGDPDTRMAGFKAVASVLFPKIKGKAFISFIFDFQTFSNWPMAVASTRCEVEVAYGSLDQDNIRSTVLHHLSQVNPENLHGCLLDACLDAVEQS